jgi:D-amino-acid dehydrogenase
VFDVIVIGGGIVGTATAYHLVRGGAKTLLIDRRDAGRATDAGAGILSAETYRGDSEAWFNFALEAAGDYPQLIAALEPFAEGDLGYGRCPKATVAVDEDEIAPFEKARRAVLERQHRGGRPAADALYEVVPESMHRLFPALAAVRGALYFADSARVDGRRLSAALMGAARAHGLTERHGSVEKLVVRDAMAAGVIVDGETVASKVVVIAGGAWSSSFEQELGTRIPVEPQRGQLVHLRVSDADTADWPIIEGFRGHYIVPWPNGHVVAGATRETGSGFAVEPTDSARHEVLTEAYRLLPCLRTAEVLEVRVGLRPLSADRLPLLGPVPRVAGVMLATGHGSTGLQLGPYSGKVVAGLILGTPVCDHSPFLVDRFSAA